MMGYLWNPLQQNKFQKFENKQIFIKEITFIEKKLRL